MKKYYRDTNNEMIAGVCAGLSNLTNIDVTLIRAGFVIFGVFSPWTFFIYIVLMFLAPSK